GPRGRVQLTSKGGGVMQGTTHLCACKSLCGWVCLMLLAWAVGFSAATAAPVWCSPFETESGGPVTAGQIAGPVDNLVGSPGQATGGVADLDPLIYVQHGQFTPVIPAAIDPSGQAVSYAISSPDDRRTGINTNLRS